MDPRRGFEALPGPPTWNERLNVDRVDFSAGGSMAIDSRWERAKALAPTSSQTQQLCTWERA